MGRRKTGAAPFSIRGERGIAQASATIGGTRYRESLGVVWRDDRRGQSEARKAAEAWYARLVQGRVNERHARITTAHTLAELVAMWMAHMTESRPRSATMFDSHGNRIVETFPDIRHAFADDAPKHYAAARLRKAVRVTVRKELSSLHNFYGWCELHGHVASVPARFALPAGAAGVRTGPQRERSLPLTDAEARAIIAALPEWSAPQWRHKDPGARDGAYRVRAVFELSYETGLRPSTIAKLEVPRHWSPGGKRLLITADIDKAGYERELPLSASALAVLRECGTKAGVMFGRHDYRKPLQAAATAALGRERGAQFARYDFRHARATVALAASQDLLGVGYMLGHKQATTTNRYLHAAREHAERVVRMVELGSDSAEGSEADSPDPSFAVGARGFEPPTPRPPVSRASTKHGKKRND